MQRKEKSNWEKMMEKLMYNDFIVPFGKYQGCFLGDVYAEDRKYFEWLSSLEDTDQELKNAIAYWQKEG